MRVFLYEYASALAEAADVPASVRIEGWAMLRCLAQDFSELAGVEVHSLRNMRPAAERKAFQKQAAKADWSLIIAPEFDDLLLKRCQWVEEAGGRLLGPSPEAVRCAGDKWLTYESLKARGVPTPLTALVSDSGRLAEWPMPWVVKPRCGAGSEDISLVGDRNDLHPDPGFLVQEHVQGLAASVAVLVGESVVVPLLPGEQLLTDDGRFRYQGGIIPLAETMAERAKALATRAVRCIPGLKGYVGVDLVLQQGVDQRRDVVIEINPRLTTSYVGLRALAENNLAAAMLAIAAGETISPVRWRTGTVTFTPDGTLNWKKPEN